MNGVRRPVIVVGGGPAGMMAAGQAALAGAEVRLIEKMDRPGRKLLLTGNGRCNVTNRSPIQEFIRHFHTTDAAFISSVFSRYFHPQLTRFLAQLGIETVVEDQNRVFPASNRARNIAAALDTWVRSAGASIATNARVSRIDAHGGAVRGVALASGDGPPARVIPAAAVILATGGASYPRTGSTGDGYALARSLGHTIVAPRPALVPIRTSAPFIRDLQGLSLTDVNVGLRVGERTIARSSGGILFTHYGLSGPAILSLSRAVVASLTEGAEPTIVIDLLPDLDMQQLDRTLLDILHSGSRKRFAGFMHALLPRRLIALCAAQTAIPLDKPAHQISAADRRKLTAWLKGVAIKPSGSLSFAGAMVTAGGVSLDEVDPATMESRLVRGLYVAGEVLDIDADTGGYNLQAAFSTGWIAGRASAGAR